ncbi:MAG: NADPH:quinone oxidoreductase family protein [Pseudomonadota bacterium]
MKALLCRSFGPPSSLAIEDLPEPRPGPGEVAVSVQAAALNFFDTLLIENKYQFKPDFPFSPGAEMAGKVQSVGAGVTGFHPGDRVMGYLKWGCVRETVIAPEGALVRVPDSIDATAAAGLSVTYGTSLHGLRDRASLAAGETVAVLGASGGVGQSAVEIAKAMGARVIACASSDEKLAFCREHGADETINYATEDLKNRLKELTGGKGVDVVYDPVGGDYAEPALRALGWEGRFLVIGFAGGQIPRIPLNLPLLKGCDIRGVFWGASVERDPAGHRDNLRQILDWVAEGAIKPHIHGTYALHEAVDALEALAARKVMGKAVVTF